MPELADVVSTLPAHGFAPGERPSLPIEGVGLAALEALPTGILICGLAPHSWANSELLRILRRSSQETLDVHDFEEAFRPVRTGRRHDRSETGPDRQARSILSIALAGGTVPWERRRILRGDGTVGAVRLSAVPLRDSEGDVTGATVAVVDETDRQESEHLGDAFLSIVGHELRTPITSIIGGAELLDATDLHAEIRSEVSRLVVDEANRLHGLVEQLIGLARLQSGGPALVVEPVHMAHLIRRVAARESLARPDLHLMPPESGNSLPPALGDEGFIGQVLAALIDNAAKFAGPASSVEIRVEHRQDELAIHVLDEGPGLAPARVERLFDLFYRAAPTDSSPPGTGIGLYLARVIVHAMGGRVWARNRPTGGADIGFALPVAHESDVVDDQAAASSARSKS